MKVRITFIGVLIVLLAAFSLGSCAGKQDSGADPSAYSPRRVLLGDEWLGTTQKSDQKAHTDEYSPRRILLGDAWPSDTKGFAP
jgi:hypothetical protein